MKSVLKIGLAVALLVLLAGVEKAVLSRLDRPATLSSGRCHTDAVLGHAIRPSPAQGDDPDAEAP